MLKRLKLDCKKHGRCWLNSSKSLLRQGKKTVQRSAQSGWQRQVSWEEEKGFRTANSLRIETVLKRPCPNPEASRPTVQDSRVARSYPAGGQRLGQNFDCLARRV